MPALRPIVREPAGTDQRTENAVLHAMQSNAKVVGPSATRTAGGILAGIKVPGAARLKGGNPGPVGASTQNPNFL
jgi:hypothetical protein